jgi:methionine-rich copper-binding protein CopC
MALWDRSTGGQTGEAQGVDDSGFSVAHDTPVTIEVAELLANDANPHGYALTVESVAAGTGGTVALGTDGNVVFTPKAGFAGQASFSYTLTDGHGTTDTANVTLSVQSPVLDEATQKAKHAVFLGIDGTQLSKLLALASNGITKLDVLEGYAGGDLGTPTQQGTVSGPGWSTLLTGVWTNEHHITGNSNSPIDPAVVSLFERIKTDMPGSTTASVVSWPDINKGHFALETGASGAPSIVDWHAVSTGASMALKDADVIRQGVDLITDKAPTFTFLHLDNVDAVGHSVGFGAAYDDSMRVAAAQVDAIMTAIAERMAANPDEDWMLVLATDHGRDPNGFGHGGQTAGERQIFFASNKEISADGVAPQTSVAATIAEFLGLDQAGIRGPSLLDENAVDTHAPYLLATTPGDDLQNVAVDAALKLVLSERVEKGEGSITIHRASDGSVVETIDVKSDHVGISAGVVTVQPSEQLAHNTGYYVTVDAGAFNDLETHGASPDGNDFAGISDTTSWSFTTAQDSKAPGLISLTPADNAGEVAPDAPLTLTFDETVRKGAGTITLHHADGSVVEAIDVASNAVAINGNTVTIRPGVGFPTSGEYYVTVSAGAFEDMADISAPRVLFSENFEGLTPKLESYQSSSEIRDADLTDWTATTPDGWSHVNKSPAGGPVEFQGWTFHDPKAWTATEGDQGRSGFTKGQGVVAVADPDAYDDLNAASTPNKFSALLRTPEIDVAGLKDGRATVTFDSSWANPTLNTNIQEARIVVTFDNGETRELAHWSDQAGSPYFKATATNETLSFAIDVPEGATTMSVSFDMIQAGNALWWAIDNVAVTSAADEPHGNAFAGITDATAWNFSVAKTTPGGGEPPAPGGETPTPNPTAEVIENTVDTVLPGLNSPAIEALKAQAADGTISFDELVEGLVHEAQTSTVPALIMSDLLGGAAPTQAHLAELTLFAQQQYDAYAAAGVANPALGPYEAIGLGFTATTAFQEKYGALPVQSFLASAYGDVFGRAATAEQQSHFTAQITYFVALYQSAGIAGDAALLKAKGAVIGQMMGHAVLDEPNLHNYDDAANGFLKEAIAGGAGYGDPLGMM